MSLRAFLRICIFFLVVSCELPWCVHRWFLHGSKFHHTDRPQRFLFLGKSWFLYFSCPSTSRAGKKNVFNLKSEGPFDQSGLYVSQGRPTANLVLPFVWCMGIARFAGSHYTPQSHPPDGHWQAWGLKCHYLPISWVQSNQGSHFFMSRCLTLTRIKPIYPLNVSRYH